MTPPPTPPGGNNTTTLCAGSSCVSVVQGGVLAARCAVRTGMPGSRPGTSQTALDGRHATVAEAPLDSSKD